MTEETTSPAEETTPAGPVGTSAAPSPSRTSSRP